MLSLRWLISFSFSANSIFNLLFYFVSYFIYFEPLIIYFRNPATSDSLFVFPYKYFLSKCAGLFPDERIPTIPNPFPQLPLFLRVSGTGFFNDYSSGGSLLPLFDYKIDFLVVAVYLLRGFSWADVSD